MHLQLYLTKPDFDVRINYERALWEDGRERVNSEEAYRRAYQSNSGALVSLHPNCRLTMTLIDKLVFRPLRQSQRNLAPTS